MHWLSSSLVRHARRAALLSLSTLLVAVAACGEDQITDPNDGVSFTLEATATGARSIRVTWTPMEGDVTGYELQRRDNLVGDFVTLAPNIPSGATGRQVLYFDSDVQPATFYGYRVVALFRLGARSRMSTVGGTATPPPPGLVVRVSTDIPSPASVDPDGYQISVRGPTDTLSAPVGLAGEHTFSGLKPGPYTIVLRGIAKNCNPRDGLDSVQTANVVDDGINTQTSVRFEVTCRDPSRGSIIVQYRLEGDTIDADGVRLNVTGLISQAGTPDNERVYARTLTVLQTENRRFDNLRPGDYEVVLDDVSPVCKLDSPPAKRAFAVKALSADTVRHSVTCERPIVEDDPVAKPLALTYTWSRSTARPGDKVALLVSFDGSARPTQNVGGVQAEFRYNSSVIRYDSSRVSDFDLFVVNAQTAGTILYAAASTAEGLTGLFPIGRIWFTVIGAVGTSTSTGTTLKEVKSFANEDIKPLTRVREARLTVGTVASNVPPVAEANGPYAGTAGSVVTLSAAGSTDPDGTIASYQWNFGDAQTGTGVSTTHTYASAGTFTARVTVTDDAGATATDVATVTITPPPTTPNQNPVARITGPTTATPNTSVAFSASTSTDADGTIASYAWAFGDGGTATTATANHTYTAAGTYTVGLTVTDDRGGTGTASRTITVAAGGGTTGTVTGTITSSLGGPIANVDVSLTPSGGIPAPVLTTGATGTFTFTVSAATATGAISLSNLPTGCTNPSPVSYAGLTAGATVTQNITVTCAAPASGYRVTGIWDAITNTGPTGRQVRLTLQIDMGTAPGEPDINGSNADELAGIQLSMAIDSTKLRYQSRSFPAPELDFGAAGSPSAGVVNVAVTSSQSQTAKGVVQFVRITFNIPAGASGTVAPPVVTFVEVLAGQSVGPVDVKSRTTASLPALTIP